MDLNHNNERLAGADSNISSDASKTNSLTGKLYEVLTKTADANCYLSVVKINKNSDNINSDVDINKSTNKFKAKTTNDKRPEAEGEEDEDVDGGYAWIILAVIFVISASTFGAARTYSLIFEKSARQDEATSRSEAALPFTIMGSVENMAGPLASYLLASSGGSWRLTVFFGCSLISLSHLMAAFQDSPLGKILSMGLMCGVGLSLVTISFFQINNSYFVKYRSRAFGLGLTGAVFGTWYITPLCQFVLNNYGTSACYLTLSIILLPNAPLALLLKPKLSKPQQQVAEETVAKQTANTSYTNDLIPTVAHIISINHRSQQKQRSQATGWRGVKLVILNPMFHLIWPTQLLFCWFNFVFSMIIVDFGKDRGLDTHQASQLVQIWAIGQLCGRMVLGSLVDIKLITYELFTVICFLSIGGSASILNAIDSGDSSDAIVAFPMLRQEVMIAILVFLLSMFISNLYLLFNDLVVEHMKETPSSLSVGISSFTGSFFLLPRAFVIGHYRDAIGNYDAMLAMFSVVSFAAAAVWFLVTLARSKLGRQLRLKIGELILRQPRGPLHLTQLVDDR